MNKLQSNDLFEAPALASVVRFGKFKAVGRDDAGRLHYMVYEYEGPRGEAGFEAVCLEYELFAYGDDVEEALKLLLHQTNAHISDRAASKAGRKELWDQLGRRDMEDFWGVYRQLISLLGDPESRKYSELEQQLREKHEEISSLKVDNDLLQQAYKKLLRDPISEARA